MPRRNNRLGFCLQEHLHHVHEKMCYLQYYVNGLENRLLTHFVLLSVLISLFISEDSTQI